MDLTSILYERSGPVATLTMHRPSRINALTGRMLREIKSTLELVARDPEIRVLVLRGAGKHFSPGADLQLKAEADSTNPENHRTPADFRVPVLLHEMSAITVAAITGGCAGAALAWAAACDFRVASQSARFNTAFLDVGVAGDGGAPWTLPKLLGAARARELMFFPEKFDAPEALRIGLVTRVFPDGNFEEELENLLSRLVGAAPLALRALKANFNHAEKMDLASFVDLETDIHLEMHKTGDTKEAFRASVDHRKPIYRGS